MVQDHVSLNGREKEFTSKEIHKLLGLKRYEPVWAMVNKLRMAMGKRESRNTLEAMIERDKDYCTVASSEIEKENNGKSIDTTGKKTVPLFQGQGINLGRRIY